jgi:hypothetical protein
MIPKRGAGDQHKTAARWTLVYFSPRTSAHDSHEKYTRDGGTALVCGSRRSSGSWPQALGQAKSAGEYAFGSTSTIQLPELSRATASTPYGRSSGGWMNSTPLARRSS